MTVAKVRNDEPLFPKGLPIERKALVIGGGISGMQAALDIAMVGHPSPGGAIAVDRRTHGQLTRPSPPWTVPPAFSPPRWWTYAAIPYPYPHLLGSGKCQGVCGNFEVKIP